DACRSDNWHASGTNPGKGRKLVTTKGNFATLQPSLGRGGPLRGLAKALGKRNRRQGFEIIAPASLCRFMQNGTGTCQRMWHAVDTSGSPPVPAPDRRK